MRRTISLMMIAAFIAAFVMTVPFGMAAKADEHCSGEETEQCGIETLSEDNDVTMLNDIELDPSVRFLYDYNIPVTAAIADEHIAEYVLGVVESVKADGNHYRPYGYDGNQLFFDRIADATRDHYNIVCAANSQMRSAAYTLRDSVQYKPWLDMYGNFNCYSYVLGVVKEALAPGQITGDGDSAMVDLIRASKFTEAANLVVRDLNRRGYNCVHYTTVKPSDTALNSAQMVICMKMTSGGKDPIDFHFMKYSKDESAWLHKPGRTTILKYIKSLSAYNYWTNEGIDSSGPKAPYITYTSAIYYYFVYTSHGTKTYPYNKPSTSHDVYCTRCSKTIDTQVHVLNSSQTACKVCGCPVQYIATRSFAETLNVIRQTILPITERSETHD